MSLSTTVPSITAEDVRRYLKLPSSTPDVKAFGPNGVIVTFRAMPSSHQELIIEIDTLSNLYRVVTVPVFVIGGAILFRSFASMFRRVANLVDHFHLSEKR